MSINIPYNPSLRNYFKNITACILFQQLCYWVEKNNSQDNSFYKFVEPCKHPLYKQGDSWCEELNFSKKEFKHARLECITHYSSKKKWKQAVKEGDPFKGKPFCSYVDKQNHLTHYVSNYSRIEEITHNIDQPQFMQSTKGAFPESPFSTLAKVPLVSSPSAQKDFRSIQEITQENTQEITCLASSGGVSDYSNTQSPTPIKIKRTQLSKPKKSKKPNPENQQAFSELLACWPTKEREQKARGEFDKHAVSEEMRNKILNAAKIQTDKWNQNNTTLQYVPYLCNWLKEERWNEVNLESQKKPVGNLDRPELSRKARKKLLAQIK